MAVVRSIVAAGLCFVLLAVVPARAAQNAQFEKVSFYFVAHEDDWQLIMNPSAFEDVISSRTKTVFVHLTAGDAGLGTGRGGRKHPFYLARENGAAFSIRFMADADNIATTRTAKQVLLNRHSIYRASYRNTVSYYLRVPDGDMLGPGYKKTGFQSLKRLADGENKALAAIDGSTVYNGWNDLVSTLRHIMDFERGGAPNVQLSVSDPDTSINPDDHSDHMMTAKAALDAAANLSCARRVYYVGYAAAKLPENLNAQQRDIKGAVFAAMLAGILEFDHRSTWLKYSSTFLGRTYFRVAEGDGPCR